MLVDLPFLWRKKYWVLRYFIPDPTPTQEYSQRPSHGSYVPYQSATTMQRDPSKVQPSKLCNSIWGPFTARRILWPGDIFGGYLMYGGRQLQACKM